ncbi:hypothetical protein GCM10009827_109640 [Dactylosporangium maewongense]|uniref:Uncharacterized protein n=1 Tax=Dactylosporangium maewongense TaxID=634393 RepID=A0ABP4NZD5_9ACTN
MADRRFRGRRVGGQGGGIKGGQDKFGGAGVDLVGLVNSVRVCDVLFRRDVRPAVSATMEA